MLNHEKKNISLKEKVKLPEQLERILIKDLSKARPGDKMLPERALAEKYNISRRTARAALGNLTSKGLLERRVGKGTFVSINAGKANDVPSETLCGEDIFSKDIMEKLKRQLNMEREEISLQYFSNSYLSSEDYIQKLVDSHKNNERIDIVSVDEGNLPVLAQKGLIMPLDEFFEESEILKKESFHPNTLEAFKYNGLLYGIPQTFLTVALFYNKDLFDRHGLPYPGKRFQREDFLQTAITLTDSGPLNRNVTCGLAIEPGGINDVMPFVYQCFEKIPEADGSLFAREEAIEGIQFLYDLMFTHRVCAYFQSERMTFLELFKEGYLGMYAGSYRCLRELESAPAKLNWDVCHLPEHRSKVTSIPTQGWAIFSKTSSAKKSFRRIEKILEEKNTGILCDELNRMPANGYQDNTIPKNFSEFAVYGIPSKISFPAMRMSTRLFQYEMLLMLNNFGGAKEFCQRMDRHFNESENKPEKEG